MRIKHLIFLVIVSSFFYLPFLGGVHLFDWDEINFAEAAREMILTNDYLTVKINFQPFWEKPPLFVWFQVISMKMFGINEYAARLPNAICGIITLIIIYNIGRKFKNERFGFIWTFIYLSSTLPHFYFKSGIIDPWFNLFIFLGIYEIIVFSDPSEPNKNRNLQVYLAGLFIGLGILTKGPVAFLIFLACNFIFIIINKFKFHFSFRHLLIFSITVSFIGGLWFIIQIITGNFDFFRLFIEYQVRLFQTKDSGHGGFFLYHFVVLFFGVFPASVFAIIPLTRFKLKYYNDIHDYHYMKWMQILFWLVLILFSIVKTKIVHYSSLCYFPMTFLSAYYIISIFDGKYILQKWIKVIVCVLGILYGFIIILLQVFIENKDKINLSGLIKDEFAIANLQANVYWSGFEFLTGIFIICGVLMSFLVFRGSIKKQIGGLFISNLIFISLTILFIVPKVEGYTQRSAIEFYKSIQSKDCYVETLGFKSYAQLFYSKKKQPANKNSFDQNWLLTGKIDKPVYFVTKITNGQKYQALYPQLEKLYESNGFVFFIRNNKKD